MKLIENGSLGQLSVIGLGCWNLGGQWGKTSKEEAIDIIRTAIDKGVNFVDVAESYGIPEGECEILLGKALQDGYRNKVKIVSKVGWYAKRDGKLNANNLFEKIYRELIRKSKPYWLAETRTPELIKQSGYACCGRMHVDFIDVLLCHDGFTKNLSPFVEGFNMLQDEGIIKYYGISTDKIENLKKFYDLSQGKCSVCEFDYSLLNKEAEKGIIPFCIDKGITMLTRGSLARGLLSGKYTKETVFNENSRIHWNINGNKHNEYLELIDKIDKLKNIYPSGLAEIAYKYVFSQKYPMSVVMGCTSIKQLYSNLKASESFLPMDEIININNILQHL